MEEVHGKKIGKEIEWTIAVDENAHKAFLTVAQANKRSPAQLIREFMDEYVKTQRPHEPLVEQPDQKRS
ncbi:MAG: hypothetical protein OWS74_05725 [Firmicutes bacterium]|nr:hypothetical protein [Bacillota bacterium]